MAMVSENIENILPVISRFFAGQPVLRAWLFGSCSRGEEHEGSDVDILVEYDDHHKMSLYAIAKMMCALEKLIDRTVDIVEYGRLLPFAQESAERDKILIYERKS